MNSVGDYEVSTWGRVRKDGELLKLTEQKGYLHFGVLTPEGRKKRQVHVVVLETFVGPRPQGHVTRHMDNNGLNDYVENLRWSTQKDNIADKKKYGTDYNAAKTHCPQGHTYSDAYRYTDKNGHARRMCRTCQIKRVADRKANAA